MREQVANFRHGHTFTSYCAALGLVFFSVGFYRGLSTSAFAAAIVWWVVSAFWLLELMYAILTPYVSIDPKRLRIRRWVFLPPQDFPREGLRYEIVDDHSLTFRCHGAKAATVQKVRMDEGDWERFLDILRAAQEPGSGPPTLMGPSEFRVSE